MEDDRSGIIPEITDSYKYEEQILMGSADVRDAYLADRQLINTGILLLFFVNCPSKRYIESKDSLFLSKIVYDFHRRLTWT